MNGCNLKTLFGWPRASPRDIVLFRITPSPTDLSAKVESRKAELRKVVRLQKINSDIEVMGAQVGNRIDSDVDEESVGNGKSHQKVDERTGSRAQSAPKRFLSITERLVKSK